MSQKEVRDKLYRKGGALGEGAMAEAVVLTGAWCGNGEASGQPGIKTPNQGLRKELQGERRPRSKEPHLIKKVTGSPQGARLRKGRRLNRTVA